MELNHLMTDQDLEQFKEAYMAYCKGSLSSTALYNITDGLLGKYGIAYRSAELLNTLELRRTGKVPMPQI